MSLLRFGGLTIYQNFSNNNQESVLSYNGTIEILEDEKTKNLEIVLSESEYSMNFLKCKLVDLNLDLLTSKFGRVHLQQKNFNLEISYFVEFKDLGSANEFMNAFKVFNEESVLSTEFDTLFDVSNSEEECENVQGLCSSLEKSIKDGNEKDSIRIVKILAAKRLHVNIKIIENKEVEKIEPNEQILSKVNVNLIRHKKVFNMILKLQPSEFTVLDLKKQVFSTIFLFIIFYQNNFF